MLHSLAGRAHKVATGVAVAGASRHSFVVTTTVRFIDLDDAAIERYVATEEPLDKAGAYGIQGIGGALVRSVSGSYTNVVGLPLAETVAALLDVGIKPR